MRHVQALLWLVACCVPLQSATLERLTVDDMIEKSTAIVRGRIAGVSTGFRGTVIYTTYKLQVIERWKGPDQPTVEVMVPGGVVGNARQYYSGSPQLTASKDYLLFLWTSKAGITYVIGFTQGLFELPKNAEGNAVAVRPASNETMLDPGTGAVVKDQRLEVRLSALSAQITTSLQRGATR